MAEQEDVRPELLWDDFFMTVAGVAAKRSKLGNKVGAVIVTDDNRIVGSGYNGTPLNHPDPGNKVVCAVTNAMLFRSVVDLRGTTLYTTALPTLATAILIVQSRIKYLHYLQHGDHPVPGDIADLFCKGDVIVRHFKPRHREVVVNFAALGDIDETDSVGGNVHPFLDLQQ